MSESIGSLQPAIAVPTPVPPAGSGHLEVLSFGSRMSMSIDRYRLNERFDGKFHGEDLIKFTSACPADGC